MEHQPRLRKVNKVTQLYPLNQFPIGFAEKVSKEIFAVKSTSIFEDNEVDISGKYWEEIFARNIGAVRESGLAEGLDDVRDVKSSTAWSAKTVKYSSKKSLRLAVDEGLAKVQLISGRNNPLYSFDHSVNPSVDDPVFVGGMILSIWNTRLNQVKTEFSNLRTVVLVKAPKLKTVAIFEKTTDLYHVDDYEWKWNKNNNLEGSRDDRKRFTWQPHGSQFTINDVIIPKECVLIDISSPKRLNIDDILRISGWNTKSYKVW